MFVRKDYTGNIYIASDFHLGIDTHEKADVREYRIVQWLDSIKNKANLIILNGDIFDYWFEYKQVIPRGFHLFWAKISELRSLKIPIIFFTGNHDMWMFDYATTTYNIPILQNPTIFTFNKKRVLIHHGDGLGPGDYGYKLIKKIFANKVCQWLFARLHPNLALGLMKYFSKTSRSLDKKDSFDPERERLLKYCEKTVEKDDLDFLVFGHRHLMINHVLSNGISKYINLGDWLTHFSYAEFTKEGFNLIKYE